MKSEYDALMHNHTWDLVTKPSNLNKTKTFASSATNNKKSCLVA